MSVQQRTTIVGVFEDRLHADMAVDDLRKAGFRDEQIGVARRRDDGETEATADEGSHAGTGAVAGAVAGAGLGGLVGLGIIAGIIPAIGPVIAGGTLAAILANAAGGAAIGGLIGTLTGSGIPEEEAHYYQNEFEEGRTIVTVKADGRNDEAMAILRRHGAYDMQTAGSRTAGTTTSAAAATSTTSAARAGTAATARTAQGTEKIQVREEELQAHKRPVEAGEVRVHKEVHTEHRTIDVPVQHEEVIIERRPAHGQVAAGDLREGEEIRIPVREEQVDVSKHAVVTEEVEVGKRVVQDTKRVSGDVRKEEVHVEREGDVDVQTRGTGRGPK